MDDILLKALSAADTPSVCNAIEVAQGKRGFSAFTRGTMQASAPRAGAIVGYARTARISGLAPPQEDPDTIRTRRMDYYRYMSEGVRPALAVVEDLDFPNCVSAYWGEVNTTVHKGFGLSGALTNGVMRDLGDLPDGFSVVAGSIGPSHAFVHVREIDCEVTVFGLKIQPGDLVHADRHGALVVPADVIPALAAALAKMYENEKIVLEAARADGFDFAAFERAWREFEARRT